LISFYDYTAMQLLLNPTTDSTPGMGYRYLEEGPAADLTVEAWGETLEEAYANIALAMFNAITPLEGVEIKTVTTIEAEGDDLESLLFNFLDELLYVNDVDHLIFKELSLSLDMGGMRIRAECGGEEFELGRHEQGIAVKAVTFHLMLIERAGDAWLVRVVFDT
jgi:SHS2 domain-containing protein